MIVFSELSTFAWTPPPSLNPENFVSYRDSGDVPAERLIYSGWNIFVELK